MDTIVVSLPSSHRCRLFAEAEHSRVTQTEGGDGGLVAQRGLVVTVPADAVVAVPIQVTEQRVEAAAARLLHGAAQRQQQGVPLRGGRREIQDSSEDNLEGKRGK